MSTIEQPLLTVRDVAETLNVSASTVRRYVREGTLPAVRFAGSVRPSSTRALIHGSAVDVLPATPRRREKREGARLSGLCSLRHPSAGGSLVFLRPSTSGREPRIAPPTPRAPTIGTPRIASSSPAVPDASGQRRRPHGRTARRVAQGLESLESDAFKIIAGDPSRQPVVVGRTGLPHGGRPARSWREYLRVVDRTFTGAHLDCSDRGPP
jgi:excisionase family DNA binding protein